MLLAIALTAAIGVLALASPENTDINDAMTSLKDETIYVILENDGSVELVKCVNHLEASSEGIYADYGDYEEIIPSSAQREFIEKDGAVLWSLEEGESFYYQGVMKDFELPYAFNIEYSLDGAPVNGDDLGGKSGKIGIKLTVTGNEKAHEYFKDNFACQIQVPLDCDSCRNIDAPGAVGVLVGSTRTLTYNIMPGTKNAEYEISFDAKNFTFSGMTFALSAFDISSYLENMDLEEIDALGSGLDEMADGVQTMLDGTNALKDGMTELDDGTTDLADGAKQLSDGIAQYSAGVAEAAAGAKKLKSGSSEMKKGLKALDANSAALTDGFDQIMEGISSMLGQSGEYAELISSSKTVLAEVMNDEGISAKSKLMLAAMLKGITDSEEKMSGALEGSEDYASQLKQYSDGLKAYTSGVGKIANSYGELDRGIASVVDALATLSDAAAELSDGAKELSDGTETLSENVRVLPGSVGKLADGQKELLDGINTANEEMSGSIDSFIDSDEKSDAVISFADTSKEINSVQFVFRTSSIGDNTPAPDHTIPEDNGNFFTRLVKLFKKD